MGDLIDLERRQIGTTDQFGLEDRYPHRVFPREWLSKGERPSLSERAKAFAQRILRIRRPTV